MASFSACFDWASTFSAWLVDQNYLKLMRFCYVPSRVHSILSNWKCKSLLIQTSYAPGSNGTVLINSQIRLVCFLVCFFSYSELIAKSSWSLIMESPRFNCLKLPIHVNWSFFASVLEVYASGSWTYSTPSKISKLEFHQAFLRFDFHLDSRPQGFLTVSRN